ncbi:hypothetical protein HK100_004558 [Physocladia obscura]|uniref:Uncharacterized protein n=1 Tax=Physocladia obscura TaxID=109957 RepID=A0AAD5STP2_9FUNG|nr:hypothetical protein HK100_004558 [Physocladia obscura]
MVAIYNPDGSYNYTASVFGEKPSSSLAIIGCAIFALIFFAHLIQSIQFKTRYLIPMIIASFMEVVGYAIRYKSIGDPFNLLEYSVQQTFIILAPIFLAASQYIMLEKLIINVGGSYSPIRHTLIAKIFVGCDILSFLVQCAGSAVLLTIPSLFVTGTNILIAGLVVQVISFTAFLITASAFYYRASQDNKGMGWRIIFIVLFASATLVLIRSVFRVIEFSSGYSGPIVKDENYMYAFDFGLIAIAIILFNFFHPARYIKSVV